MLSHKQSMSKLRRYLHFAKACRDIAIAIHPHCEKMYYNTPLVLVFSRSARAQAVTISRPFYQFFATSGYFMIICVKFSSGSLCIQYGCQTGSLGWGLGSRSAITVTQVLLRGCCLPRICLPEAASPPITIGGSIGKSFHTPDCTPNKGESYVENWGIHVWANLKRGHKQEPEGMG